MLYEEADVLCVGMDALCEGLDMLCVSGWMCSVRYRSMYESFKSKGLASMM